MADRSISYSFKANISDLQAKLAAGGRAVSDFGSQLTALDEQGEDLRANLSEVADQVAIVGVAAGSAFTAAVLSSANFEQALSGVQAATGESAANMERLSQAALDAGSQTVFSASEAAAAIENLAKAGVSTDDILSGALSGSLDLAAAGQLEVAEAAEFTATALTQFSLSGDQATHVADLLAAGAGKAQGEVSDMANALNYAGVPAANLGVSIEETSGAIALLAKNGIIGEQAGTSLRGMLASLTSPSAVAKAKMDELGISVFDAQGKFVGFEGVAGQLQQRMSGLTDAERANALGRIFGNEQLQAANVLYREGAKGVAEWEKNVNDSGYAADAASTRLDNLKGDFEGLKGAFDTALIGTGSGQQGPLRDLTQSATELINVYNRLPGPVKSVNGALLGITAITAGGFWLSTKAISSIAATRTALQGLGLQAATTRQMLMTLGKGAAVFTGIALAIPAIADDIDTVGRSFTNAKANADGLDGILDSLSRTNVGKFADDLGINMEKLAQDLYANGEAGEYVQSTLAELGKGLDGVGDNIAEGVSYWTPFYTSSRNKEAAALSSLNDVIAANGDVLGTAESAARKAALAEADLSGEALQLAEASGASAEEVKQLAEALKKAQEQAAGAVGSFINLSAGVKDGRFSFKEWIAELREAGDAVRDFRNNADKAERRGLDAGLITELESMGTEGAVQLAYFARANERELAQANRAWRRWGRQSSATIDEVANDLIGLGAEKATPEADLNLTPFQAKSKRINDEIRGITGKTAKPGAALNDKAFSTRMTVLNRALARADNMSVTPRVDLAGVGAAESELARLTRERNATIRVAVASGKTRDIMEVNRADGGTIPGPRDPYRDKVLSYLAPGEEVTSNRRGQADTFRSELKDINAGMSRSEVVNRMMARGLADGGTVSRSRLDAARHRPGAGNPTTVVVKSPDRMRMTVELKTPWGVQTVEGIARSVAREEIDQQSTWERTQ